jgi:hypothetical protein
MLTITKKDSYEFDYKHNLNNNFNTVQHSARVLTLLCLRICVTTTEYCLIGLKIKHHHQFITINETIDKK